MYSSFGGFFGTHLFGAKIRASLGLEATARFRRGTEACLPPERTNHRAAVVKNLKKMDTSHTAGTLRFLHALRFW